MRSLCQYGILQSPPPYQGRFTNSVYKIDYLTVLLAIHRLNGLATPANAAHSVTELAHQLKSSGAVALFTCASLLDTALEAAQAAGISQGIERDLDLFGRSQTKRGEEIEVVFVQEFACGFQIFQLLWRERNIAQLGDLLAYPLVSPSIQSHVRRPVREGICDLDVWQVFQDGALHGQFVQVRVKKGEDPFRELSITGLRGHD